MLYEFTDEFCKFLLHEPVRADSCQTNCRSTNEPRHWYSRSTGNAPSPQDHSLTHASTTWIKQRLIGAEDRLKSRIISQKGDQTRSGINNLLDSLVGVIWFRLDGSTSTWQSHKNIKRCDGSNKSVKIQMDKRISCCRRWDTSCYRNNIPMIRTKDSDSY